MTVRILHGDCRELMKGLADDSVHSIVTDPPYGIGFMGKAWDHKQIVERAAQRAGQAQPLDKKGNVRTTPRRALAEEAGAYDLSPKGMRAFQDWTAEWAAEAFRILKPGAWLLCFASTRTYHRMACGLEEAGFEIRDQIGWLFGSGFPKNRDFAKDHEASKASGERVVRAEFVGHAQSEGWGTALKPGWEPIAVARKPFRGPVGPNVLAHGTGVLNINGCRVLVDGDLGRWPANVVHDGSNEVLDAFPDAPGQILDASASASASERKTQNVYGAMRRGRGDEASANSANEGAVGFAMRPGARRLDAGSAARFFYCAKASKADREVGCEGLPTKRGGLISNTSGQHITRRDGGEPGERSNHHPTVKPTELMRWLCRLVTPPGGTILDPFAGSGTTGRAADIESFDAILMEEDAEYIPIIRRRVSGDAPLFAEVANA